MAVFYYKLYGINIESQIELKYLVKGEKSNDDVKIRYGEPPKEVYDLMAKGCNGYCTTSVMWFNIKNVAIYYVCDGKNVIVKPYDDADKENIRAYLLGTALGMILLQRNIVAIHGATILVNDKAITIVGDTGAGKSTLSSALRLKGYPFMADDVSALEGKYVNYSYPLQKLCKDAMYKFDYDVNSFKHINDDRDKYIIPVENKFIMEKNELKAIFQLSVDDVDDVKVEELTGSKKLEILMKNIYRVEILEIIGINNEYFRKCLSVASNIHLYKIIRPKGKFSIDRQIEVIEEIMESV